MRLPKFTECLCRFEMSQEFFHAGARGHGDVIMSLGARLIIGLMNIKLNNELQIISA